MLVLLVAIIIALAGVLGAVATGKIKTSGTAERYVDFLCKSCVIGANICQ